jgi:hypothetical protein
MNRDKVKETIEAVFLLGQLFQAYVSMLMVYRAANRNERFTKTLPDLILHIQSLCSTLGVKSPCKMPANNDDASKMLKNFFLMGGQLANDLKQACGKTVGATFLFASSSLAHCEIGDSVDDNLRKSQIESLNALGFKIGLSPEDVKTYLGHPDVHRESLIKKIIDYVASHDTTVLSKINKARDPVVELKPSFHGIAVNVNELWRRTRDWWRNHRM